MNAATLTLDRPTAKPAVNFASTWELRVVTTPLPPTPKASPIVFPANSLARLWLAEPRRESRLRRAGEGLGYGLVVAGGLWALGHLAVSAVEFTNGWAVFARFVASAVS